MDCGIADYIGFHFSGTRRITDCGVMVLVALVVAVVATCGRNRISGCIRSSADYGLWGYGFVRIAECARISCGTDCRTNCHSTIITPHRRPRFSNLRVPHISCAGGTADFSIDVPPHISCAWGGAGAEL